MLNRHLVHPLLFDAAREIIRVYFSSWEARWYSTAAWSIDLVDRFARPRIGGSCDHRHREILIHRKMLRWRPASLRHILIHEFCHAVGPLDHALGWQTLMRDKCRVAVARGEDELAFNICLDVTKYVTATVVDPDEVDIEAFCAKGPEVEAIRERRAAVASRRSREIAPVNADEDLFAASASIDLAAVVGCRQARTRACALLSADI